MYFSAIVVFKHQRNRFLWAA